MAYYKLNAYDADVWIPSFAGMNQAEEIASDLRFASVAENVETLRGVLQPMAEPDILSYDTFEDKKIETLAQFHRRWYTGTGSKDWMVVAADGNIYVKQEDNDTWIKLPYPMHLLLTIDMADRSALEEEGEEEEEITNITAEIDEDAFIAAVSNISGTYAFSYTTAWDTDPSTYGITVEGTPINGDKITVEYKNIADHTDYQSNVWSCVTYEINPDGATNPVDVLLMSNAKDGMIMVVPPYTATVSNANWRTDEVDTRASQYDKRMKFGVIERYAERIWGGAMEDDPDTLVYSRPYDPTDWRPTVLEDEEPEDGAGDIQQPSWDGDSFTALKNFGNQLIAFKKHRVWRILGTDPGEYTFKEQFGGGTPYANTLAIDNERILMAERDGLSMYDGLAVAGFMRPYIEQFWKTVNPDAMDQMCAVLFKNRYYLAVPTNGSTVNNALIVYNAEENTFIHYTGMYIESLMATENKLYATSSTLPGKILIINYDSWDTKRASGKQTRWVTPWIDFGRKSIAKGGYEVYFSPEVKDYPVTFRFSIQTEKKIKYKTVVIQPTIEKAKQKKIRFGGVSRRFRLCIEVPQAANNAVWRLIGGIQMVVEIDPD